MLGLVHVLGVAAMLREFSDSEHRMEMGIVVKVLVVMLIIDDVGIAMMVVKVMVLVGDGSHGGGGGYGSRGSNDHT
jgi:hypothetical protein